VGLLSQSGSEGHEGTDEASDAEDGVGSATGGGNVVDINGGGVGRGQDGSGVVGGALGVDGGPKGLLITEQVCRANTHGVGEGGLISNVRGHDLLCACRAKLIGTLIGVDEEELDVTLLPVIGIDLEEGLIVSTLGMATVLLCLAQAVRAIGILGADSADHWSHDVEKFKGSFEGLLVAREHVTIASGIEVGDGSLHGGLVASALARAHLVHSPFNVTLVGLHVGRWEESGGSGDEGFETRLHLGIAVEGLEEVVAGVCDA